MDWKAWYRKQIGKSGTLILIVILAIIILMLYFVFMVDASPKPAEQNFRNPDSGKYQTLNG